MRSRSVVEGLASWREQLGYVAQATHLFPGTLLENVAYGETAGSADREPSSGWCSRASSA